MILYKIHILKKTFVGTKKKRKRFFYFISKFSDKLINLIALLSCLIMQTACDTKCNICGPPCDRDLQSYCIYIL